MIRVSIYHNNTHHSLEIKEKLNYLLNKKNIEINDNNPNVIITIGGDGTVLGAFHHYENKINSLKFIGVHTGHLGFYTDWHDYELDILVDKLINEIPSIVYYPLLKGIITYTNNVQESFLALNESSLKRLLETLRTDVYISGNFFERFRGDGLCISTPTGSTAYNKSIGGAVVHPCLKVMQMAEIASINNLIYRTLSAPIVLAPNDYIDLRPEVANDYVLTMDEFSTSNRSIKNIHYEISNQSICFLRYRNHNFWDRVEGAFIGLKDGKK